MYFLLTKTVGVEKGSLAGLETKRCLVIADDIVQAAKKIGREITFLSDDKKNASLRLIGPEVDHYESWVLSFIPECGGVY